MKHKLIEKITRFLAPPARIVAMRLAIAALAALAAGGAGAATDKTNPVTDDNQSYTYNYTGSGAWTASDWDPAPSAVPQASGSGVWDSLLIDGNVAVTAPAHVEGWSFRIGLFGGATLTVPYIRYWNGTAYAVVDTGSKLTIQSINTSDNWNATVNYYVAAAGGITYTCAFNPTVTANAIYNYNLKGAGSVVYELAVSRGSHVIKQADVTLSGNATPSVESKMLVSFGSGTTATFTADAAIKVYDTDGTTLVETVNLAEVKTAPTLTADDPVGSCELVKTSTGIVLKYVDGDPSAVVAKTYKPSININFCFGNAPLTTAADVGYSDYAVPGTSWNNMTSTSPSSGNGTFTTPLSDVYAVKTDGTKSLVSGASVALSGTLGSYRCNSLAAATDLRHGYIDENANNTAPTVTVSGIPYDKYKVVVYTATDSANSAFGYVSVNGTDYTYANGAVAEGTAAWGASGAQDTANALAEGVNVLVSPVVSGATATIVGHKSNGRGCIAAVQIVKVAQTVGENDLLIELDGDRTYTFDEAKAYSGTVYVLGEGTVTFAGAASTAATLHIGPAAAVNMVGSALTPTAVTGNGTAVYDGAKPTTGLGWTDSANWQGTLWVINCSSFTQVLPNTVVNANSILRLTDCSGYFNNSDNAQSCDGTLELVDGNSAAFTVSDGYSSYGMTTFAKLIGDGTLTHSKGAVHQRYVFTDPSEFNGTINIPAGTETYGTGNNRPLRVILGNYSQLASAPSQGSITIAPGATATVASGKTWTAAGGGIAVYGTLNVNGTLAVSSSATAAVSGSGTVVFTGRAPTPVDGENETKWWKNANWTGTVQIASVNNMTGNDTGTKIAFNDYGNANSIVELNNVTGWLPNNYTCTPKLKITGTLSLNNGSSGKDNAFKVGTLLGSGTISGSSSAPTAVLNVTGDSSGFTGTIGLNDSKCIVFGSTIPDTLAKGTIYISEGAVAEIKTTTGSWWATGGIVVNGTLKVTDRDRWGGGTAMTLGDNGILELTSTANKEEYKDYSGVTGTGTIKYSSTAGWRLFPNTSEKMPATTLTIQTELVDSLIIACTSDTVIGNLAGSKNIRSDWGDNSANGRTLTVTQSKDTEWSGKFLLNRITQFNVNPGASTTGTLTLSGTQTISMPATISGSVNLTGTWVGATTVSGTFGGTGTLTGNLTFSDGSTFKAFASDTDGLSVSGTVTTPGSGTVTVDVSAISESITASGVTLISGGVSEVGTFAVDSAYRLAVDGSASALKVYPAVTYVAEYGGIQYETVKKAIDAAEQAGQTYAAVIILDANATCPEEYYIDTDNSNALTKCQAAIVKTDSSKVYFKTAQLAFDDISATTNLVTYMQQGYTCVEVYSGTDVAISINASATIWSYGQAVKIRCLNSSTVSVSTTATESTLTAGTADENDIVTYTSTPVATTYVWAGTAGMAANWSSPAKWKVGSAEGATASRAPGSTDTVVFSNGASVSGVSGISVAALQVSGTVTFTGGGTLTSASAITLGTGDSIEITGTLSPVPTTSVADSYVKATTSDGKTTYAVVAKSAVEIGEATFEYSADYTTAKTVTATVTGEVGDAAGTTWTLTVGDRTYDGTYNAGTVTFENVTVTAGNAFDYTIAAGGHAAGSTGSKSATAASVTGGWIAEDSTHSGTGTWNPAITYSGTTATFAADSTNTFTATTQASGIVTLTTVINFGAAADTEITVDSGAKGAIRTAQNGNNTVFQLWTKVNDTAAWQTVSGATPNLESDSRVEFTFDTAAQTYSVKVGENRLCVTENETSVDDFPFASAGDTIGAVTYIGAGTFTSLAGAYSTTNIMSSVDGANIVISADFISAHLSGMTAAEAAAALAPNASGAGNANGLNYFTCYALDLDPTDADDKPIVSVTTDAAGNFVVTVTDKDGNALETPTNVSVTPKFYKYTPGNTPGSGTYESTPFASGTIPPGDVVGNGNVGYIRAKIEINAK